MQLVSTAVYRDPSAWYHFIIAIDTTQATASNRAKMYVNGSQITAFDTATYPTLNADIGYINTTTAQQIGALASGTYGYFSGYLTEVNFIDGSALTPSSFGETDAETGAWKPKKYTGTYGTNGFYLNFSDNSGTTSTTLGKDYSPNGNNWTPNNFSVTAGAGNDSLVDTPTQYGSDTGAGGEVRGNYAVLNPLDKNSGQVPKDGNLLFDGSVATGGLDVIAGTVRVISGKWYWESTITNVGSIAVASVGITKIQCAGRSTSGSLGGVSGECAYLPSGNKQVDGSSTAYGASFTTGDVIGVALDCDTGAVTFYKNNVSQGSISDTVGNGLAPALGQAQGYGAVQNINFGQRPFEYSAPSGFKALCTTNLPTPTIGATSSTQANKYFDVDTYTGNGGTLSRTGFGFQPDFIWSKPRSLVNSNQLFDAIRGNTKILYSDLTNAETTVSGVLDSFDTSGYTVGSSASINQNAATYVSWLWKANGAGSSNTAGTITSTVSANITAGFSIVTYTGTGANGTVGHGLGVAPKMVIVKSRSSGSTNWQVYHANSNASPATGVLFLDTTNAFTSSSVSWNNTAPTSSVFSIGTATNTNNNGTTYVAYCFSEVAGYSAFGSYTGNGSADGPFVFTNMRPAFILIKRTDTTSNWTILDLAREGYNVDNDPLYPNLADAEGTADLSDILSNGFKLRSTDASVNANTGTYIYMSLASNPFKYSLGR
jgi:hypothetical protein